MFGEKELNPLPNDRILNWPKFKAFGDNKMKLAMMIIFVFDRIENILGKGENAGYQHFLLLAQFFLKAFSAELLKVW